MADSPQETWEAPPGARTLYPSRHNHHKKASFWHKHSLSIVSVAIVTTWLIAYCFSDPSTHVGSFFGNAIADWTGVVVTVLATKWLYEKNSRESRKPPKDDERRLFCLLRDHSLSIFLVITGIGWIILFAKMDANGKWGQVVGNIVSEWTQIFGMVILTKRLIEWKSRG
jgi:hypothetical protein